MFAPVVCFCLFHLTPRPCLRTLETYIEFKHFVDHGCATYPLWFVEHYSISSKIQKKKKKSYWQKEPNLNWVSLPRVDTVWLHRGMCFSCFCLRRCHSIDHSHNWHIHVKDNLGWHHTSLKMRHNRELRPCTNQKNTLYIFTVLYLILIHYEIKMNLKYIYCHKSEMISLLIHNHNLGKIGKSQSKFIWWSVEGDCNAYALITVNAPIMRMVYCSLTNISSLLMFCLRRWHPL